MGKLKEDWPGDNKYIWKCDGSEPHYLEFQWDEDEKSELRWLEINELFYARSWRDRIKTAFSILRGKKTYYSGFMVNRDDLKDMIEVMSKHANE